MLFFSPCGLHPGRLLFLYSPAPLLPTLFLEISQCRVDVFWHGWVHLFSTGEKWTSDHRMPLDFSGTLRDHVKIPVSQWCLWYFIWWNLLYDCYVAADSVYLQIYFVYHSSPATFWDRDCIDRVNLWTTVLYFLQVRPPLLFLSLVTTIYFWCHWNLEKTHFAREMYDFLTTASTKTGIKSKHKTVQTVLFVHKMNIPKTIKDVAFL